VTRPRRPYEQVLGALERELRGHGRRHRRRIVEEARDHLLTAIEAEQAQGVSEAEAEHRAAERFGDPRAVASQLGRRPISRAARVGRSLIGATAALVALTIAAGPLADGLQTPAAVAAMPVPVSVGRCAQAWDSAANARWRAYAARLRVGRAQVQSVGVGPAPTNPAVLFQPSIVGCAVKLWLPRERGPFQTAIRIAAPLRHGVITFGVRWNAQVDGMPRRVHERTAIQYANSRVTSDGTIEYAGKGIP
jgi:hypothetical protein